MPQKASRRKSRDLQFSEQRLRSALSLNPKNVPLVGEACPSGSDFDRFVLDIFLRTVLTTKGVAWNNITLTLLKQVLCYDNVSNFNIVFPPNLIVPVGNIWNVAKNTSDLILNPICSQYVVLTLNAVIKIIKCGRWKFGTKIIYLLLYKDVLSAKAYQMHLFCGLFNGFFFIST